MPVTARLSKHFYDRLGDDVANELVNWFNSVDFTYRSELKELNTQNFALFDAKLGQRFAEFEAKADKRFAEFDAKVDQRFTGLEAKTDKRFAEFEAKTEKRFAEFEAKTDKRFVELEARIDVRFAEQDTKFEARLGAVKSELLKWMFVFWASNMIAIIGFALRAK